MYATRIIISPASARISTVRGLGSFLRDRCPSVLPTEHPSPTCLLRCRQLRTFIHQLFYFRPAYTCTTLVYYFMLFGEHTRTHIKNGEQIDAVQYDESEVGGGRRVFR